MGSKDESSTVEFARALGDPTRLQIMEFCCCDWRSVTDITESTKVSQPTVSHHLALLRDANLVEIRH
jgi:DNA-binding transcriptional ArsR family regulator